MNSSKFAPSQLCLGSAQFGLDYGITNNEGKIPTDQLCDILSKAFKNGISYIDTAPAYGDAEKRLGDNAPLNSNFRYLTKLSAQSDAFWGPLKANIWENSINRSLNSLNTTCIDTLLLHSVADLSHVEADLLTEWLSSLKARNKVKNIGVSIYNANDLENLDLRIIDVVQLPFSIYDQRCLLDGTLDLLQSNNIKIFARSIFLQGLLLSAPEKWPSHFNADFLTHHKIWLESLQIVSISPLQAIFSFLRTIPQLTGIIVGINSLSQFNEILSAWHKSHPQYSHLSLFSHWNNSLDLDPRKWPIK